MTLTITISNETIQARPEGRSLVVTTPNGEYRHEDLWLREPDDDEENTASMLRDSMAFASNGTEFDNFEEWSEAFATATDPDDDDYEQCLADDRASFEAEQLQAARWHEVSNIDPGFLFDYLTKKYNF